MTTLEKLNSINDEISKGLSVNEIIKLRKKLYQIKSETDEEWFLREWILTCIKQIISDSKKIGEIK